jgi:serine protease Do
VEVGSWVATPGNGPVPVAVGVVSVATRKMPTLGMPRFMPSANSGFLGVLLGPVEEGPGVVVNSVEEKSPAEKAGLKAKDVVLSVNGQTVSDVDDLRERLGRHKPGDEVEMKVKRGKEELTLKATLGKRPSSANRGDFQNSLGSTLSDRRTGFPVVLQHDQVLKPTDCGGPVVDLDGCAVGVNIARAGRTESFAIPTESVLPLLFDLASGKLTPPTPKGASTAAPASPSPGSAGGTTNTSEQPAKPPAAGANPQRVADAEAAVTRARAALAAAEKALAEAEAALKKATQPPK